MLSRILLTLSQLTQYIPPIFLASVLSNILILSIKSIGFNYNVSHVLHGIIILVVSIVFLRRFYKHFKHPRIDNQSMLLALQLFILCLFVVVLRSPMIYPTYDDFAYHFWLGDVAMNVWSSDSYLPLWIVTYSPPFYDMNYSILLNTIGIRATIMTFGILLVCWYVSLYIRMAKVGGGLLNKLVLFMIFVSLYFYPHMMATHGTLMTDYASMLFSLESVYLLYFSRTSPTLGVVFAITSIVVKQSTGIFLLPLYAYLAFINRSLVKWRVVSVYICLISIYFLRQWVDTGNPLFSLLNSVFRSPMYPVSSLSNPLFGPNNMLETLVWPIVAQFSNRYGEGLVSVSAKYIFSWVSISAYVLAIFFSIYRRSVLFMYIVIGYVLWSLLGGYSRYYTSLNSVSLVFIWDYFRSQTRATSSVSLSKLLPLVAIVAVIPLFSSLKTDFSWRPYPSIMTPEANEYLYNKYSEGWSYLFMDTPKNLSLELKDVFSSYDTIMVGFRGQSTMLANLAIFYGKRIATGVTLSQYESITSNPSISDHIKDNLRESFSGNRILLLSDDEYSSGILELMVNRSHICSDIGRAPVSKYLQREYFYSNVKMWSCVKR